MNNNNVADEAEKNKEEKAQDRRTDKKKTGDAGEDKACLFLSRKGFRIVCRNFSCKAGELDIVAADDNRKLLIYVEVKSRNSVSHGLPCQAVGPSKQQRIKRTAMLFYNTHPFYKQYSQRIDIIEILELPSGTYIRQLENAF